MTRESARGPLGDRLARRLRERSARDPYEGLPVDAEYGEPILPRWFVLALLGLVVAALVVGAIAFVGFGTGLVGGDEVPLAERRPPPEGGFATGVGEVAVEAGPASPVTDACPEAAGVPVGGTDEERGRLAEALEAACAAAPDALDTLADAGAEVRFAGFERTGVDAATDVTSDPPWVLVNGRYTAQDAALIVPLLAHEAALIDAAVRGDDVGSVEVAVEARERQHAACGEALDAPSRACEDAAALLAADDAAEQLREAGFR